MYSLSKKKHIHLPSRRNMIMRINHILHDSRFWAIFALSIFFLLLMILSAWAIMTGQTVESTRPIYPVFPYAY